MLRAVAAQVGDNQVRHRGTIGGSVAHGDPASDLPAALLALDATFVVQGPNGERHDRGARLLPGLPRDRARARRAADRDPCAQDRRRTASASRSSTGGRRTTRSSVWSRRASTAQRTSRWSTWAPTPLRAHAVENALAQGASRRRRGARSGGRHRAARRPQRVARVPRAPRAGARPARARGALIGSSRRSCSPRAGACGSAATFPKPLLELRRPTARRATRSTPRSRAAARRSSCVVSDDRVAAALVAETSTVVRNDDPEQRHRVEPAGRARVLADREPTSTRSWSASPTSRSSAPDAYRRVARGVRRRALGSRSPPTAASAAIRCCIAREHWAEALAARRRRGRACALPPARRRRGTVRRHRRPDRRRHPRRPRRVGDDDGDRRQLPSEHARSTTPGRCCSTSKASRRACPARSCKRSRATSTAAS